MSNNKLNRLLLVKKEMTENLKESKAAHTRNKAGEKTESMKQLQINYLISIYS